MNFSFFKNVGAEPQEMSIDIWNEVIDSPQVKYLIEAYRKGNADAKRKLPAVTWQASFKGKKRKNDEAIPSGLYMLDIDHITEDVRQLAETKVLPNIAACGIAVVHVTPSGRGLRIVARMLPQNGFGTIAAHQKWLANALHFDEYDACTKDLSRLSFVVMRNDVIYFDQKIFSEAAAFTLPTPAAAAAPSPQLPLVTNTDNVTPPQPNAGSDAEQNLNQQGGLQQAYRGVALTTLAQDLVNAMFPDGVFEGERNNSLFKAALQLRYITDFNAQVMAAALPHYGLSMAEVIAICNSAVQQPRKSWLPFTIKKVLEMHHINANANSNADDAAETEMDEGGVAQINELAQLCSVDDYSQQLPPMPPLFDTFVSKSPNRFKAAQALSMLPTVGALASRIRAQYLDKLVHSPSFLAIVYAPQATGKSFVGRTFTRLTQTVAKSDRIANEAEHDYMLRRDKDSKVTDPRPVIRIIPAIVSVTELVRRQDCAKGLHLLTYASEIDSLTSSRSRGAWADASEYDRNSFDNDRFGQMYINQQSTCANEVTVYHNKVMCGTPMAVDRYVTNCENGLASRIIFIPLKSELGCRMPVFEPLTHQDEVFVDQMVDKLMLDNTQYDLTYLNQRIEAFNEHIRMVVLRTYNEALDTFYKRAAVIGFRAGLVAAACYRAAGRDIESDEVRSAIGDFAEWVAHYTLAALMVRYADNMPETITRRSTKLRCTDLYAQLNDTFTTDDLSNLLKHLKRKTQARKVLYSWRKNGLIVAVAGMKKTFSKNLVRSE